jgi:hypothetical protein
MTTAHANCTHPATKADRLACRKAKAAVDTLALDLLKVMTSDFHSNPDHWTFYAASRFAQVHTDDRMIAARAVLDYFLPSGDQARDDNRRRNGYTVTTDLRTMRSITLNAAS